MFCISQKLVQATEHLFHSLLVELPLHWRLSYFGRNSFRVIEHLSRTPFEQFTDYEWKTCIGPVRNILYLQLDICIDTDKWKTDGKRITGFVDSILIGLQWHWYFQLFSMLFKKPFMLWRLTHRSCAIWKVVLRSKANISRSAFTRSSLYTEQVFCLWKIGI